ncbi:hypothetical protein [Polaribacter sp. Asnod1-A03]|uniref:hypothetical protein n=1 Tax=Polaribacter sp. Asnod1-A03 TaxID=3160581 RepID=UPI003867943C
MIMLYASYKRITVNNLFFLSEDYVTGTAVVVDFPKGLKEVTVVISVEPYPDNSTAPFTFKPLAHNVPTDAMNHSVIKMVTEPVTILTRSVVR